MHFIAVLMQDKLSDQFPSSSMDTIAGSNKKNLRIAYLLYGNYWTSPSDFLFKTSSSMLSTPRMFLISLSSNFTFQLLELCKSTLPKYTAIIFNTHCEMLCDPSSKPQFQRRHHMHIALYDDLFVVKAYFSFSEIAKYHYHVFSASKSKLGIIYFQKEFNLKDKCHEFLF